MKKKAKIIENLNHLEPITINFNNLLDLYIHKDR